MRIAYCSRLRAKSYMCSASVTGAASILETRISWFRQHRTREGASSESRRETPAASIVLRQIYECAPIASRRPLRASCVCSAETRICGGTQSPDMRLYPRSAPVPLSPALLKLREFADGSAVFHLRRKLSTTEFIIWLLWPRPRKFSLGCSLAGKVIARRSTCC
jgi:hypothetical protein